MHSEQLKYIRLVKKYYLTHDQDSAFFVYWSLYLFLFFTYVGYVFLQDSLTFLKNYWSANIVVLTFPNFR